MMMYKHVMLHKIYNEKCPEMDWLALNFQQTTTQRQTKLYVLRNNNFKIGNSLKTNRLHVLNNKIELNGPNKSLSAFKVHYKSKLLTT